MEKAQGKLEALCEMCTGGKATAFCRQCVHFICDECVNSHRRMKMFSGHVISTQEELKQSGVAAIPVTDIPPPKCADHGEPKKIFCYECNQLICRDCVIFDHRDHKSEFVKKAAPETRKNLVEHLSPLKNLLPGLSTAVNRVRDTKQGIQANEKLVEKQVNAKFQELHDILEQCKARVLREASAIVTKKTEKLTVQEKELDLRLGSIQSLIDFVEQALENASDEELITMQEQVVSRIDTEVVKQGKEADSADPVEKVDFEVEVAISKDLKELCKNNAAVYMGYTVRGDGIQSAEVDKPSRFTLYIPEDSNRKAPATIEVNLLSLVEKTSIQLEAVPIKKGVYGITYIPKVRGRHHLLISVDGHPITGSPFSVFVRIPPTKMDKPVRITEVRGAVHIACNSSNETIVTEYGGDVVVMSREGSRLPSVAKSRHGMGGVCGVAVDKDDNIYVSDAYKHCLYKFNKNGDLLNKLGKKGKGSGEFDFPRGMAVAGDRLFVCDRKNHRIQVLTTDLEIVDQFGSFGTGEGQFDQPESIAVDDEQLLYVADSANLRIQVFTTDGQFVRSFPKKEDKQQIRWPQGVCIDASYVYIVEFSRNRISVFTKDGRFVKSFGEGHIKNSYGACVDSDGFVYVCSNGSHRVVVF